MWQTSRASTFSSTTTWWRNACCSSQGNWDSNQAQEVSPVPLEDRPDRWCSLLLLVEALDE